MKIKRIIISFILCVLGLFLITRVYAANLKIEIKQEYRSPATVSYSADNKIKEIKVYKKNNAGKFILIIKKTGLNNNSGKITISPYHLSTEKKAEFVLVASDGEKRETVEFTVDKIKENPEINPEETAKPSWTPVPIPTKPTPSIHPSEVPGPSGTEEITEIKFDKNSLTLKVGQKEKLTYKVKPEGAKPNLTWRTDANEICSVEADGTITGKSVGEATISIKSNNGVMDICEVKVVKEDSPSASASAAPATPSAAPSQSSNPGEDVPMPGEGDGNTYYVSKDGSDSNSGKEESKPFKTIQKGVDQLKAGDKLVIKAGTYKEKINVKKSGTKEKPIAITTKGKVKIDGEGKGGILLTVKSGTTYVSINGITFQNLNGNEARGVSIEPNTKHIAVYQCDFINIKCPNPSKESNTANAIYLEGSGKSEDKAIDYVTIKECKLSKVNPGWSEGISVDCNCKNITIDKVTSVADGEKTNIAICICGNDNETNSEKSVNRPRNVVVKNCNVSGCKSPYGDTAYGIYVDGAYNVTIENNTVVASEGGIEVGSEKKNSHFDNKETQKITVKNNTIKNCPWGMYIGGYSEDSGCGYAYDVTITGNKITECGKKDKSEMITFDRCKKVSFKNNTIQASNKARIIYLRNASKELSFGNNSYSNGRKASSDDNFGKEDSDYSFNKWKDKFNDAGSTFKE